MRPKDKLFASECVSIGALEMLKNSFEKGLLLFFQIRGGNSIKKNKYEKVSYWFSFRDLRRNPACV